MNVKIAFNEARTRMAVVAPYNAAFVQDARNAQGKWDGQKKAWMFDAAAEDAIRASLIRNFGTDGAPIEIVTLVVSNYSAEAQNEAVTLFGATVAKAFGRDSGAKLGEGIILISGQAKSGGSVARWKTILEDATFEITKFPKTFLDREDVKTAIAEGWCKVKETKKQRTAEAIKAEIEQYQAMIAKLQAELAAIGE